MIATCSWCHRGVPVTAEQLVVYCPGCGHQAGVSRLECSCPKCRGAVPWIEVSERDVENALARLKRGERL